MHKTTVLLLLASLMATTGCVFVDDAESLWQQAKVDPDLIGIWAGNEVFGKITFQRDGSNMLCSVEGRQTNSPTCVEDVLCRSGDLLGYKVLIVRDVWPAFRRWTCCTPGDWPEASALPAHLQHGYLIMPYSIEGGRIAFLTLDNVELEKLILQGKVSGFPPTPPPANDFSPPIVADLGMENQKMIEPLMRKYRISNAQ